MCVFSDCMLHYTAAVHEFLKHVIKHILSLAPNLKKSHILLTGQVPNIRITKIFATFYFTKKISMLKRNGTFLSLAMVKDPVMGLEVLLRGWLEGQVFKGGTTIQTPQALFEWCNENILNIKSFFVSSSEIDENKRFLESRFDKAKTIPGTPFLSFVHS